MKQQEAPERLPIRTFNRYFNRSKLVATIAERGYYDFNECLCMILGITKGIVSKKLNQGSFTWEETIRIARAFDLTFTEFYLIFLDGLYDREGNLVHVPGYIRLENRGGAHWTDADGREWNPPKTRGKEEYLFKE